MGAHLRRVAILSGTALAAFLLAAAALAQAPDLLVNGDFDSDTTNWGDEVDGRWNAADADGDESSGAYEIRNREDQEKAIQVLAGSQCATVKPNVLYWLSASAFVAAGQPRSPFPGLRVETYSDDRCGSGRNMGPSVFRRSFPSGIWARIGVLVHMPANVASIRVYPTAGKEGAGPGEAADAVVSVLYDNVSLIELTPRAYLPLAASE